jgi:hypothetical protein
MRKSLLALVCLLLAGGLAAAAEVTLLKFDKESKELTVKEGDAEKVYRITDATRFFGVDPDGTAKPMTYDDALKGLTSPKSEGALKFQLAAKEDEVVEAKFRAKKRK